MSEPGVIELRIEAVDRLFDALDPFPLPSRDLAAHAEDFIVGWARELPDDLPLRIVVHVPHKEAESAAARQAPLAFERHFRYRADRIAGDMSELLRIGRVSLVIGLGVLALCVMLGRAISAVLADGDIARIVQESLLILGWVVNWRPVEIFLYDWWPLARRIRLYRRLANAPVEFRPRAS